MVRTPSLNRLPVRFFLLFVAVVLVLPCLLFGGILLDQFAESERSDTRTELLAATARLADAVDRELGVLVMATRVLASSQAVADGNLTAFAADARAAASVLQQRVFLLAPDGTLLVSTRQSSPLASSAPAEADIQRVIADRQPLISDLEISGANRPTLFVLAPVLRDNQVVSLVGLSLDPSFFAALVQQQAVAEGWIASVRDGAGKLIARTTDTERFLGTLPPGAAPDAARAQGSVVATETIDGLPALAARRIIQCGWRLSVAVLRDVVEAPVRRSELWLALTGVAATTLGILLARRLASRISVSLGGLAQAGRDLGAGRDVAAVRSSISEVQDVSSALIGAHAQLRERSVSLADERARLAAIIEMVPIGLLIADAAGRPVDGNRQLTRMLPRGEDGVTLFAIDDDNRPVPDAQMPLARALAGEDPAELRARFRRADGSMFWAQAVAVSIAGVGGEITGAVLALLDIDDAVRARQQKERWADQLEIEVKARTSELQRINRQLLDEVSARGRAEDQLRQAQKMEAVGRLTGGIAHDFNNLLTVILGSLELLRRRVTDARGLRLVDSAADGASRAAELVVRLLAFSRRQPLLPQRLDVNQLVLGMSTLLRRSLGETISIETLLDDELWPAMADPNQLESALLNLAVNARDAILEISPGGGRLRIQTSSVTVTKTDGELRPGDYVTIATIDSGSGMSQETLAQVFEPFFTTKPHGKGTGLGLSQVHGFAVQSGGHVTIASALGHGTTVTLFLPRAESEAGADPEATPRIPPAAVSPGAEILLVEDEPAVRLFAAEALGLLGYRVVEASGAEQALALLDRHPDLGLMVTDVVMPGMNGRELARDVQRRRPDLPILLASGFNRGSEDADDGRWDLLPKPFTVAALGERVNEVLRKHDNRRTPTLHGAPLDA